ncbi:PepSY domain-containing protein [Thalassolituus marinus]|uniref:PepSY domain-containing protein n=1 Tax=Thalassolituus marinus TaxID=671053 RepID=A0ABS7ZPR2_9GAMM|nr:PepSY domain-containing protein [Thalassolituus marinus]MCA6062476.1 PepSY domain-containing protein [Thalassolituus marinus]
MKTLLSITAVTAALTTGAFSLPVLAGDDFSAEEIQQLVSAGIVQPLDSLLQAKPLTGKLLDSELERDDGRWVYEVKWLDEEGRRHETEIDANTGKWLDDDIKKR